VSLPFFHHPIVSVESRVFPELKLEATPLKISSKLVPTTFSPESRPKSKHHLLTQYPQLEQ